MNEMTKYSKIYTERYGFSLVMIEPNQKHTTRIGWGDNTLDTPEAAIEFYETNPTWGVAFELGKSKLCSLDIDCEESFNLLLADFGFDPKELNQFPTIKGASKGKRIMFREPEGVELPYTKLNWPTKEDQKKKYTVFELRAADGKHRLDMAPPSIHKDTGKPYEWQVKPPKTLEEWPTPPEWLLAVWGAWDSLGQQFRDSCPWLEQPEIEKRANKPTRFTGGNDNKANEVVDTFNRTYHLEDMLNTYGYAQKGKRYLSPHSTTGLAGVHILTGGDKCWIHHASDPLCSEEKGQPVSSYDLYVEYDHGGDKSKAFKQAAKDLGIDLKVQANTYTPPPLREPIEHAPEDIDHHELEIDFDPFIYLGNEKIDKTAPKMPSEITEAVSTFVDTVSPLGYANSRGVPLNHHENLKEICNRLGVVVRYNVIKKDEELVIPRMGFSLDNQANASLAWLVSQCSVFNYPTSKVQDFVTLIADSNPYNPVAEWVGSKPWDGVSRLKDFYNTVTIAGNNYLKEELMKKWMLSAICGAFSPFGVSAQGVLVMQGAQGLGKTSWFKSLAPSSLGVIKDGMLLRPENKDSVKEICSHWLVELGELDATFKKSDIAALKSFLTNDRDILRMPFTRKYSEFVRRTVFFGSVNPKGFLHDPTGNRRYWTLEVTDLDSKHDIDMQQLWAEFYTLWKGGENHYLSAEVEALLNESNDEFQTIDPIEERITHSFNWNASPSLWGWLTATEITIKAGFDRPTKGDVNAASAFVKTLNGEKTKKSDGKRLLFCAPEISAFDK